MKEELLKKIIEKSVSNGYLGANDKRYKEPLKIIDIYEPQGQLMDCYIADTNRGDVILGSISEIIFSHEFAKAFWNGSESNYKDGKDTCIFGHTVRSDKYTHCYEGDEITLTQWQYHLQLLVLAEDRMKYLAKFL